MVKVWDPTDKGYQPRGKQVSRPEGIWYTPVTGIWQTVWLEPVSESYIQDLRITPDIDNSLLSLKALVKDATSKDLVEVKVFDGQQLVAQGKVLMENVYRWQCRRILNYGPLTLLSFIR